jgi:lipid-A-disaccharide synthase
MGVIEVLPRARTILHRVRETVADIVERRPAVVVTIDSSGFTWRIAQQLRRRGERVPLVHYVAPMVWAWRAGRARRMARWYDHLMALLPFEPPYFERVGLSCSYVGHPVLDSGADRGDAAGFRAAHGVPEAAPLLCVLPGSRRGETGRLLPVFGETVALMAARHPELHVVIPTVPTVAAQVREAAREWAAPTVVVEGGASKYGAFAASRAALAASGTVALELAMARLPSVIAYKINPLTAAIVRRLVKIPYANLVNLLIEREAVPEMLLERCNPPALASVLAPLLADETVRARQLAAYEEALEKLGAGGPSPSMRAAEQVLRFLDSPATAAHPRR